MSVQVANRGTVPYGIFTVAVLAFLAVFAVLLAFRIGGEGVKSLAEAFPGKVLFVRFNGGYTRLLGRRLCNNRVRLRNGGLTFAACRIPDVLPAAAKEASLARWLKAEGIPFIHVQAAMGVDLERTMVPEGFDLDGNEQAGVFVSALATNGVDVLDLRARFAQTADLVGRYYFRTDHHWTYDAAFEAAGELCRRLLDMTGDDSRLVGRLDASNWKRRLLPRWRLGSHGARTGAWFAGLDDIPCYEPRFKMELTCDDFGGGEGVRPRAGGFRAVTMEPDFLKASSSYSASSFTLHPRILTLGRFQNAKAPVDKRVLLIADSFGRPFPAYLLSVYRRVDLLDPRHFGRLKMGSVCDYIRTSRPDVVVMLMNPTSLGAEFGDRGLQRGDRERMFDFGTP